MNLFDRLRKTSRSQTRTVGGDVDLKEVSKGLDDTIRALRWSKAHLQQRTTPGTLRLMQQNLGYLALALDWQMEGEGEKTKSALKRIWWSPQEHDYIGYDPVWDGGH